jgi:hypothetical protein
MRLSDLLHSTVVDADDREIGSVDDVRLVQDGPPLEGIDASFRVDALIVGRGALGVRLGMHRQRVRGPLPLKALFAGLERRAWFVTWDEVAAWDGHVIRLRLPTDGLRRLADVV